ncbi:MAG: hypothetical protein ACI8TL_001891 [Natronomonas sp.]|jgi:hypothetical protein
MPDKTVDSPQRRKLLAGVGTGIVAYGSGVGTTAAQSGEFDEVTATLNNVGTSAWEVTTIDGDDELAETGVENPELTLEVGARYTFQNDGWGAHPLAFRGSDGEVLLSQDGNGSFEGGSETDWVDEGASVSFAVTDELADELDNYICTVHGSMEGSIRTVQQSGDDAPAEVAMSDQSSDGTTVTVDSARLDEGGFVTIHDSRLTNGEPLASVRGTSEYLGVGTVQNLEIELDDPLEEGDTLIAMPHRDSNDNETYDFVESEGNDDPPYTRDGNAVTDDAAVRLVDASVNVPVQATGSSTFTQDDTTAPGVLAEVTANTESAVVVTYEDDGDLVVAGLGVFGADELDGEGVVVAVEDAGGFPGDHTAHAIPTADLSGEYAPGDTVSGDTAGAVVDNDTATVHRAELAFADQTGEGPVESGDAMATVDASVTGGDAAYTVDVHVTDDGGSLVGDEWIGSTSVLTGENDAAEVIAERVPDDGEDNELPFSGTGTFVAMIHLAEDASAGDSASPGTGPVVPNIDAEAGAVPGGVTASAEITAEADDMNDDDSNGMDDGDDMDGDDGSTDGGGGEDGNGGSSDGSGPGFGPVAGAAGLSGLAAYAYRKLTLDSGPATPEDDDLGEDAE